MVLRNPVQQHLRLIAGEHDAERGGSNGPPVTELRELRIRILIFIGLDAFLPLSPPTFSLHTFPASEVAPMAPGHFPYGPI